MTKARTSRQPCSDCGGYDVEVPAGADVLEVLDTAADAHRTEHAANPGTAHIRRQAAHKRGDGFYKVKYGPDEDGSQTLCGAPAGGWDIGFGDARFARMLAVVTCEDCKARYAAGEGRRR